MRTVVLTLFRRLVGLGVWEFPRQLTEAEQAEKVALIEEGKKKAMPEGTNMDLVGQVFRRIDAMKTKYRDSTKDYCKLYPETCFDVVLPGLT